MDLLEVCSDNSPACGCLESNRVPFCRSCRSRAPRGSGRSCAARAARDEAGLGPEYGVVTDRDYVLATPLWAYADILTENGEFARQRLCSRRALRLFQARGTRYKMADVLATEGRLALLQGDVERARALLREAVTLGEALNYQRVLGEFESVLGLATLYCGDVPEARRLLADSLRICLDLNDEWFLAQTCTYLAELALWEGELTQPGNGWRRASPSCDRRLMNGQDRTRHGSRTPGERARRLPARRHAFRLEQMESAAASPMSWPGPRASWPTPRWRRCVQLLTLHSLPRRSRRGAAIVRGGLCHDLGAGLRPRILRRSPAQESTPHHETLTNSNQQPVGFLAPSQFFTTTRTDSGTSAFATISATSCAPPNPPRPACPSLSSSITMQKGHATPTSLCSRSPESGPRRL